MVKRHFGRDDSAKAPWGWDDSNDGTTYTGEIFYNPIDMINVHLSIQGEFSFYYTFNPYAVIVRLDEYKVHEKEIFDIDVKGYLNLFMFDGEGRYTWKSILGKVMRMAYWIVMMEHKLAGKVISLLVSGSICIQKLADHFMA